MTIGQRIAEERKRLGISQEALGEKLGISRQAISKWESDASVPEIDKLIALSKLFSVSVGWLRLLISATASLPWNLCSAGVWGPTVLWSPSPKRNGYTQGRIPAFLPGILPLIYCKLCCKSSSFAV